ncbi:MAG: phosphatase PAP2 family protein [Clostridia bacterium]|nr:phosphatase PAP2 family protein [Clostridia bacterium]
MDIQVLQWFHEVFHDQTWLNYIMKYITYIGEFGAGAIVCAIVLLIFKKTRWAGVAVAIALVLDVLIVNVILKLSVNRPRPWETYPDLGFQEFHNSLNIHAVDSSFPSGHTAALFAAAVALVMYYKAKGLPALGVALLVAISRLYLCMHYPTDVIGGIVIGTACGVAGYFLMKLVKKFILQKFSQKSTEPPTEEQKEEENEEQTE